MLVEELRRIAATFRTYEAEADRMAGSNMECMDPVARGVRAHGERKQWMWGRLARKAEASLAIVRGNLYQQVQPI